LVRWNSAALSIKSLSTYIFIQMTKTVRMLSIYTSWYWPTTLSSSSLVFFFRTMIKGVLWTNYIDEGLSLMGTSLSALSNDWIIRVQSFDPFPNIYNRQRRTARVISLPIRWWVLGIDICLCVHIYVHGCRRISCWQRCHIFVILTWKNKIIIISFEGWDIWSIEIDFFWLMEYHLRQKVFCTAIHLPMFQWTNLLKYFANQYVNECVETCLTRWFDFAGEGTPWLSSRWIVP
jgi:hypothetical protein